ncbi:hypothetical protein E2C01_005571 [Portunus trituberculatus]|uniref:Uncharacterized protein n=1 Tax=Portunus trituberculatus TaxID=210409 RepID=A0A5B7CSS3_PORTR|nr:hypothetical protein [Portunus trituberculatus]
MESRTDTQSTEAPLPAVSVNTASNTLFPRNSVVTAQTGISSQLVPNIPGKQARSVSAGGVARATSPHRGPEVTEPAASLSPLTQTSPDPAAPTHSHHHHNCLAIPTTHNRVIHLILSTTPTQSCRPAKYMPSAVLPHGHSSDHTHKKIYH